MTDIKVIETRDGSSSLLVPDMNETYHSTHGAITESGYVFLKMGLNHLCGLQPDKKEISLLEIGFGTGLNAWLTALATPAAVRIEFTSIEKYPLEQELVDQLNYKDRKRESGASALFDRLHTAPWGKEETITDRFSLKKVESDIFDFDPPSQSFDLVYFDAFAPSKQPGMWVEKILNKMYNLLVPGGIFVTYCAQGQFKRDLKKVGFVIEELHGPPGKKEMTRGTKPVLSF